MLHEPTDRDFHSISPELNIASGEPIGIGFGYNNIATVTIAGLLKWTNYNLSRAPQGRQDLKETGLVRLEIFDTEEMREYLETESDIFEYLSIKFIG